MSPLAWFLVLLSQVAQVTGQVFLKRAMARRERGGLQARGWIGLLVIGIVAMTLWFLPWLGVMGALDLSQLMPLEGISPILIVLAATFFLGERLNARGWVGILLTSLGVVLVSLSRG